MIWKKLGKIFDASEYGLIYAKSPQALVFDDYVRIYFSTCEEDGNKLISRVMFVDYNKGLDTNLGVSKGYIIDNGSLGCFDEHGIFPFSPVRVRDKIYAYTSGWTRRVSVSADSGIGLATSSDGGYEFKRIGDGPVLSSSLYEPYLIIDGFVKQYEGIFHMWYIYGVDWIQNAEVNGEHSRVYKIGHATSEDGIEWEKEGRQIVADKLNENECQALPTVIEINGIYHMFFCYREATGFRENKDSCYRIGYAYSNDLVNWVRDDQTVGIDVSLEEDDWDYKMMCYPNVFRCDGNIYMLYNGNEFGKYGFGIARLEEINERL